MDSGFGILCVTNRKLCREDFLERIRRIARAHPQGIILREKDLDEAEYEALAAQVAEICSRYEVPCILHSFVGAAIRLHAGCFHAPLPVLRGLTDEQKAHFPVLGASCHSTDDAVLAERLGCTYLTAGHIFLTDSKKGLPGRGLDFLADVCGSVSVPVYAIGGISAENIAAVRAAGAAGACVMGSMMTCEDPEELLAGLRGR